MSGRTSACAIRPTLPEDCTPGIARRTPRPSTRTTTSTVLQSSRRSPVTIWTRGASRSSCAGYA
nr:MAG TPA: hypothetical protein [Caudoviricetes sp.]